MAYTEDLTWLERATFCCCGAELLDRKARPEANFCSVRCAERFIGSRLPSPPRKGINLIHAGRFNYVLLNDETKWRHHVPKESTTGR
jgi:hypothetical protein